MWITFFVFSTSGCAYYTFDSILDYFQYNTVTTIKVINEQQAQFPTVTLCFYPELFTSINRSILKLSFESVRETNFSRVLEEFYDSYYGKCYRFNSGQNLYGQRINFFNSTVAGTGNGFLIQLDLNGPDDLDFKEVSLSIHNHSQPLYDILNKCMYLRTGSLNYYSVERIFTEQLSEPYSDCLKDVSLFKGNKTIIDYIQKLNRKYSNDECLFHCSRLNALEKSNCSCNSTFETFEKDCIKEVEAIRKCTERYLFNFRNKIENNECDTYCPMECDSISYAITSSSVSLPFNGKITNQTKSVFGFLGFNKYETYEQLNKNFIAIYVYYKDLTYTHIGQEAKTPVFDLVSNIGGIVGVFLGVSFLSFIELIEILFECLFLKF